MTERPVLFHAQIEGLNAIEAALRVLICQRDGGFVAQGLEIDYCTTGSSVQEVQQRFAEGFLRTIQSLLRRGRPLSALFKSTTPQEIWQSYFDGTEKHTLQCQAIIDLGDKVPAHSPYHRIAFCRPIAAAATHAP